MPDYRAYCPSCGECHRFSERIEAERGRRDHRRTKLCPTPGCMENKFFVRDASGESEWVEGAE